MKKCILFVVLALFAVSCSVQSLTEDTGLVSFQVSDGTKMMASGDDDGPRSLLISLKNHKGHVVFERMIVELYRMGEGYISESFEMKAGKYELVEFMVVDEERQVIYAAPMKGSSKAYLVNEPLPIEFRVTKHEMTTVRPEILYAEGATPEDFGYEGISFDVVETIVFKLEVYEWTKGGEELTDATMTVSSDEEDLYFGELGAEMNEIEVRGEYAKYDVIIEKDDYEDKELSFSNEELRGYFEDPLIVVFGESVSNTFTITYSGPYVNDNNEGEYEGTGIFTFDADGAPLSYDLVFKMKTGESSADAWRFLLTVTETRSSGTTLFEQVAAFESKLQFFEDINFAADVGLFDTNSPDYEEWITTLTYDGSLLQLETVTQNGTVVGKTMYHYNSDNYNDLTREAEDGINFTNAEWCKEYPNPNFPASAYLTTECRSYYLGTGLPTPGFPDYYNYALDLAGYRTGPTEGEDYLYSYTPNDVGLRWVEVEQEGNAWAPTPSWTNSQKVTWSYDSLGVPTRIDMHEWDEEWVHVIRFEGTISGNVSSIFDISFLDDWGERAIMPFF